MSSIIRVPLFAVSLLSTSAIAGTSQGTPGHAAHAPADHVAFRSFVEQARAGTARYREQNAAIADGYRRYGPDFPGMGEHWVSPTLLVAGRFEPSRPQVLSYAEVGGRPTLVGVAYALPLSPGESPPDFPHAGEHAWHDHAGALDEESVLLHQTMSGHGTRSGLRLALLHAWVWLDNPEGVFGSDNWTLPYARLGVTAPTGFPPVAAAKMVSLASGGDTYYRLLIRTVAQPDSADDAAAGAVLERYNEKVQAWLSARGGRQASPTASELETLSSWWRDLWTEIRGSLKPKASARLRKFQERQQCADLGSSERQPC